MPKLNFLFLTIFLFSISTEAALGTYHFDFKSGEAGLVVRFADNADPGKFGSKNYESGTWTYVNEATTSASGATLRFNTTLINNGSVTALDSSKDWLIEVVYQHTGSYNNDSAWTVQNYVSGSRDDRMVKLKNDGGGDNWIVQVGNDSGGWTTVANSITLGTDKNKFLVHYRYDAVNPKVDIYLNGSAIATDEEFGHGNYDPNYIQLQSTGAGTDIFHSVRMGQSLGFRLGHQYVQSLDTITIQGAVEYPVSLSGSSRQAKYTGANHTALLTYDRFRIKTQIDDIHSINLPWMSTFRGGKDLDTGKVEDGTSCNDGVNGDGSHSDPDYDDYLGKAICDLNHKINLATNVGLSLKVADTLDEPKNMTHHLEKSKLFSEYILDTHPEVLVLQNFQGYEAVVENIPSVSDEDDYRDFLRQFLSETQLDILSFDIYPFQKEIVGANPQKPTKEVLEDNWFRTLHLVKDVAQEADIPYWTYIQSYGRTSSLNDNHVLVPSESDVRMATYSALAYGYTGISYFVYDKECVGKPAMPNELGANPTEEEVEAYNNALSIYKLCNDWKDDGFSVDGDRETYFTAEGEDNLVPSDLYGYIQSLNGEIANLGKELKSLSSTDIRYISGFRYANDEDITPNVTPKDGNGSTSWNWDSTENLSSYLKEVRHSYGYAGGTAGSGAGLIALADIDDSNGADLIKLTTSGTVYNFLSKGDGTFETSYSTVTGSGGEGAGRVLFGDVDGDGDDDMAKLTSSGYVYVYQSNGDGTFEATPYTVGGPGGNGAGYAHIVDIDGDGNDDVVKTSSSGYVFTFLSNGDGTFATTYITKGGSGGAGSNLVAFGDIDDDGDLDLFKWTTGGTVYVFEWDETIPKFSSDPVATIGGSGGNGAGYVHIADLNGDGNADLIKSDSSGGVYTYLSNGDGTFGSSQTTNGPGGSGAFLVRFADLNGDGDDDLVKIDGTNEKVYTFLSEGDGTFASDQSTYAPVSDTDAGSFVKLADVNDDGKADLVIHGDNGRVIILPSKGDGTFEPYTEGDLLIGFFTPDKVYDGTSHEDEEYFMVVNLMRDADSSAAEMTQTAHLKFDFSGTSITDLKTIDVVNGCAKPAGLVQKGTSSIYTLDLSLPGGTGRLFKYDNGTDFINVPDCQ